MIDILYAQTFVRIKITSASCVEQDIDADVAVRCLEFTMDGNAEWDERTNEHER